MLRLTVVHLGVSFSIREREKSTIHFVFQLESPDGVDHGLLHSIPIELRNNVACKQENSCCNKENEANGKSRRGRKLEK